MSVLYRAKGRKSTILSLILISGIIFLVFTIYVKATDLAFEFIDITIGSKSYKVMTDCMSCHFYIAEYDTLNGQKRVNTYQSPYKEQRETVQQGYGRYHIKANTNAFAFIRYCKEKNVTNFDSAVANGVNMARSKNATTTIVDYNSFMDKNNGNTITPDVEFFIYGFWQVIASNGESFNRLQDSFVLERYVLPAARKLGLNTSSLQDEEGQELLTVLMTYVYTNMCDENINESYNSKVEKGDLVPFMYNKANVKSPYEMAKSAYIYLYYNFGTGSNPYDEMQLWGDEYGLVFNDDMDIDEEELTKLQQLADKAQNKYGNQKADRDNKLKGAKEDEIISSGYSVETKLNAIRTYTNELLKGVEVDADYRDLIDKNYLMAKHAMENAHIQDTIKDYCIGNVFLSEAKLSQGQYDEKHTKTAILSDFQVVDLKDKLENRYTTYSDDDNLSDGEELGIETERDITAFVIKCNNNSRTGLLSKVKNWAEFNEGISYTGTNDSDVIIKAKMFKYKSNPMLNDSDFDGLNDDMEHNKNPLSNDFSGSTMTVDSDNYVLDLDFNQDFRYFLWNTDTYNDELCTMSLIMSNLAEGNKDIKLKQGTTIYGTYRISATSGGYMEKLGFKNVLSLSNKEFTLSNGRKVKGNVYIGYKTIDYYRKKRGLIGIFIGGFNDDNAYKELFINTENLGSSNNAYEEIAEQIVREVDESRIGNIDINLAYWVSGKGISGGIASEVAREIEETTDSKNDVYCYTFASPYTHKDGTATVDSSIKNIINEDDFLIKGMIEDKVYYRNGDTYNASIKFDYMDKYKVYIEPSSSTYKGDCTKANTLARQIKREEEGKESVREILIKELVTGTGSGRSSISLSPTTVKRNNTTVAINEYNFKDANSTKSYYVLSKVLNGYNKKTSNQTKYNTENSNPNSETEKIDRTFQKDYYIECYKTMAKIYIENVYSHNGIEKISNASEVAAKRKILMHEKGIGFYSIDDIKKFYPNVDFPISFKEIGDDCIRFFFAVLQLANGGDIGNLDKNYSDNNKRHYKNINSENMVNEEGIDDLKKWFDIILVDSVIYKDENGEEDFNIEEGDFLTSINLIPEKHGHGEFYSDRTSSFGWGDVHKRFETNTHFLKEKIKKDEFGLYYIEDNWNDRLQYKKIYRYKEYMNEN